MATGAMGAVAAAAALRVRSSNARKGAAFAAVNLDDDDSADDADDDDGSDAAAAGAATAAAREQAWDEVSSALEAHSGGVLIMVEDAYDPSTDPREITPPYVMALRHLLLPRKAGARALERLAAMHALTEAGATARLWDEHLRPALYKVQKKEGREPRASSLARLPSSRPHLRVPSQAHASRRLSGASDPPLRASDPPPSLRRAGGAGVVPEGIARRRPISSPPSR